MIIDIERVGKALDYWNSVSPEGATHYNTYEAGAKWWCQVGDKFYEHKDGQWNERLFWPKSLIPRPTATEWSGEGLPPVGWKGELKGSLDDCEIACEWRGGRVYYNEFKEMFAWTDSGRIFRPTPTNEQLQRDELAEVLFGHVLAPDINRAVDAVLSRFKLEPKP